jgi:hypothetical protein
MPILPLCIIAAVQHAMDRLGSRASPAALATVSIACALLLAARTASFVVVYIVRPQEQELALVRAAVAQLEPRASVTVVPSSPIETFAPGIDHDEFGIPSTSQQWVVMPLTELVYRELHGDWNGAIHDRPRSDHSAITDSVRLDYAELIDPRARQ